MPKRSRTPKVELIEYKQLKIAAGGSGASGGGSGGGWPYKQGQNVRCKIISREARDSYDVVICKDNLPARLDTPFDVVEGEEIHGVFVCVLNGRILLTQLWAASRDCTQS